MFWGELMGATVHRTTAYNPTANWPPLSLPPEEVAEETIRTYPRSDTPVTMLNCQTH